MNCENALELMNRELDGALTEAESAALRAHLDACPDCRATWRQRPAETGLDVLLVWNSGVPLALDSAASETAQSGAGLYCVTGQMAQTILDEYGAAAYSPDDVCSDLPEKEAAYVLVLP